MQHLLKAFFCALGYTTPDPTTGATFQVGVLWEHGLDATKTDFKITTYRSGGGQVSTYSVTGGGDAHYINMELSAHPTSGQIKSYAAGLCLHSNRFGAHHYISLIDQEVEAINGPCEGLLSETIGNVRNLEATEEMFVMGGEGSHYHDLAWYRRPVGAVTFEEAGVIWMTDPDANGTPSGQAVLESYDYVFWPKESGQEYDSCSDDYECSGDLTCNRLAKKCDSRAEGTEYAFCKNNRDCPGDETTYACSKDTSTDRKQCRRNVGMSCDYDWQCITFDCSTNVCVV